MAEQMLHEEEFSGKLDWKVWRTLLGYGRPYRKLFLTLGITGALTAGFDALFGLVTRDIIDEIHTRGPEANLLRCALEYAAVALGLFTCILIFINTAGRITALVCHDIRRDAFARLQELEFAFYDQRSVGWLMSRLTSDCDRLARIIGWMLLDLVWGLSLIGVIGIVLFTLDPWLALGVMTVVPGLALLSAVFQRRLLQSARAMRRSASAITATYNETILGVRTTKTLVHEAEGLLEFQGLSSRLYGEAVRFATQSALYMPMMLTVVSLGTALALTAGGYDVLAGGMSLGTLVLFLRYSGQLWDPVHEMANKFAELQNAQAAAERVAGLLMRTPAIGDSPAVLQALEQGERLPERIGRVELRGLGFRYAPGAPAVVSGLDLEVRSGQTIALVGPTGGGKSTLVNLICRFYEPTEGQVLIDGVDYRKRPLHWLQSRLGIVLQSPTLFSGTIRDNIRYGRLEATDEEVAAAARIVDAEAFILALPDGYDSPVGAGGVRLSTGQKQLLSFARAILANPQILVMDEATSSVDTETEKLIQQALGRVLHGRLSFVIAHRLSTIRSADRILVIEGGTIVEDGRHAELLHRRGKYWRLYTRQFRQEQELAVLES